MVKITSECKEIKIDENKQIENFQKQGWKVCGLKSIGDETIVIFERIKNDRA